MKEKINPKSFIQIPLLILIICGLFFIAQPTQAGFFDWFSWSKIKLFFIGERAEEQLPASISEPIEEILPSEEPQEISEETQPEITSETTEETTEGTQVVEKIIYKDNPEQTITIQNLKNQIASLQSQIKNLEKQIEDLLSKSSEIKQIVKEVPVEKIVVKEVIKEVPVEKIITKEVLVPQTCPTCPICPTCPVCQQSAPETQFSEYSLSIERSKASSGEFSEVYYSDLPPTTGENSMIISTGAFFPVWEYVPTTFELKKITVKLIGEATNDDFFGAGLWGKSFYKVGNDTLVWEHSLSSNITLNNFIDIGFSDLNRRNRDFTFQYQIDEDGIYVVDGNGKQVKIIGDFPIKSRVVSFYTKP